MPIPLSRDIRLPTDADDGQLDRQLNVGDALSYLDAVKVRFSTQPDVYNHFLDIMKDFKSELIDTPGVIRRVSTLFHGHPELIQGFNTFLPVGYRIDCSMNPLEPHMITVTTPSGTLFQTATLSEPSMFGPGPSLRPSDALMSSGGFAGPSRPPSPRSMVGDHDIEMREGDGSAMEPALQYVQKIKQRCDEGTYRQFLEILGRYHTQGDVIDEREVSAEIARLFKDDPDLRSDFRVFMPEKGGPIYDDGEEMYGPPGRRTRPGTPSRARRGEASTASLLDGAAGNLPQKRKRRAAEKEREREREREQREREQREREREREAMAAAKAAKSAANGVSGLRSTQQPPLPHGPSPVAGPSGSADMLNQDETHFFERVRRLMPRETYVEFLRLINLFTQGFIDTGRLVRESGRYLGEGELARQLAAILGWDEMDNRERFLLEETQHLQWLGRGNGPIVRPGRVRSNLQAGSYRRMPASEVNVPCSGRDEMCKSVLNDEWVSHPTWASEDTAGFVTQRKNVYEEALHRSEEERHEYDFHIEAIARTIALLEPIANKIAQLAPEDRPVFKLKANLGGQGKSIHARVIKKIYGREAGLEVLQAMQENPVAAVPVVMHRLKQKEEEWKRAQREWNKVWREVDARNYARSLDHQGITFRLADKKAVTTKALVAQIEVARDAARHRRASLVDPLFGRARPRYHLAAALPDVLVLQDATKLALSFLDRTQGQIGAQERRRVEFFLRTFVPLFFGLDADAFDRAFVVHHHVPPSAPVAVAVAVAASADTPASAVPADGDAGAGDDAASSVGDDVEVASAASGGSASSKRSKRGGANGGAAVGAGGDLRKKLLKSEQAKSTSRKRGGQDGASPVPSRFASPAVQDVGAGSSAGADAGLAAGAGAGAGTEEGKGESSASAGSKRPNKSVFFANTTFYTLLRLFEILYSRLSYFKELSIELASEASPSPAKRRKLSPPESADRTTASSSTTTATATVTASASQAATSSKPAHAEQFYDVMLESCERLFDNEIEVHAFEDQMRAMFGNQDAYRIFTIDKVIGALIKQVQIALIDPRCQELFELLKRDRDLPAPTMQDMLNSRRAAEKTLGPDENIFRIDWIQDAKMMTIQLLGKDDDTVDSEIMTERWQAYVDAFVSGESPENLASRARQPFLKKHAPKPSTSLPYVLADGALEMRVCVRTYRVFYVSHTEDFLCSLPRRSQSAASSVGEPDKGKEKADSGLPEEGEADFKKRLERKDVMRRRWMESVGRGEWPVPSKKVVPVDSAADSGSSSSASQAPGPVATVATTAAAAP
ncbi:hypothetical protein CONPUDRAFT_140506 [Coniophora puteana RWD-64-598 SS2]|uniref:Histone deacetylase interacting domain-containing protein n=1 Tax=Coniophora puteana (strain RWD-64-598) TaxID=741705 RepID=R7SET6_CONPW|nr:uncharacterized protein CONPUDRAFT_140506 [Coniophora puteana RWD-64-598 SS2]EIW74380.1 hypothetical protein CONPUDRAFT_140506 [Coniophora puteana RWD-64-598 SS2]